MRLGGIALLASAWACVCALAPAAQGGEVLTLQAGSESGVVRIQGREDRQQLLATFTGASGREEDLTRRVEWLAEPRGVVGVDRTGRVSPLTNGVATVRARVRGGLAVEAAGLEATLRVEVSGIEREVPVHFANQVVPILTKNGCNGGGCHGKAAGQNGFRLSLLGFEPAEDYEHLVKEARGRRLFPAAPEQSLFLLKATAALPHGGGRRLDPASDDYRLLVRWIGQGMPRGDTNAPVVRRIEVFPKERTMALGGEQQLAVWAHYSDGTVSDVTRGALFEPNEKDLARVDETGYVKVAEQPGEVAVMVRYQAQVGVFRATLPLGADPGTLPEPNNFIDRDVFAKLRKVGIPPSALCDDHTFIRRVTLDIAGRLPTEAEVMAFVRAAGGGPVQAGQGASGGVVELTSARREAREAVVTRLLESAEYADYFANKWSALLRNKRNNGTHARGTYAFHAWIRDNLWRNRPFDEFVRDILTASGEVESNPAVVWYRQVNSPTAQLEDTAQLFLGTRMQCAQCHHHPYEKWSQQDYYGVAAFFAQVGRKPGAQPGEQAVYHKRGVATATNKKTRQAVKPAGLGAPALEVPADEDPRVRLADWMTDPKNPFFARTLVNRYWKHFLGRGLVEPEDDLRETNPPTNPELLDHLAARFVESGYDLKALVRWIVESRTYQLSSTPNPHNGGERQFYSRFYPRRLPAEVLYDAINDVTLAESRFEGQPRGARAVQLPDNSFNASSYFLTVFGRPESSSACECERSMEASLSQSLHLLNAKEIQEKLMADQGRAARLARDGGRDDTAKLTELYLSALGRPPTAREIETAREYAARKVAGAADDKAREAARRQAYEDTVWALLSTKEFLFNH